jgi:hypothetical protein
VPEPQGRAEELPYMKRSSAHGARPEDLDAFRASGDPDDEPVDFSPIRRFEIEQYSVERRI